jgi:hypothetical protein
VHHPKSIIYHTDKKDDDHHPKLDMTGEANREEIKQHQSLIGAFQWAISLLEVNMISSVQQCLLWGDLVLPQSLVTSNV